MRLFHRDDHGFFSGPWTLAPGFLLPIEIFFLGRPVSSAREPDDPPLSAGEPTSTRIIIYFKSGRDTHQIPGEDGDRARIGLAKTLLMRFIESANIGCRLDRDMLDKGADVEVSPTEAAFTVSDMIIDEVLVIRLGHLLLRTLVAFPIVVDGEEGEYPLRVSGFGFMYL